ncbi:MAG: globin family protein [Cyanobacteriota bacterium]|nr:globin family protein [Cyanobacteriota bacterium]
MSFSKLQATQLDLIEYSFERIRPHRIGFTSEFYSTLLSDYPEVKPLFSHSDIAVQYDKLMDALVLVVDNLRAPTRVLASLRGLGARHVKYGVLPEYYPMMGKSLLATLATYMGSEWTQEMKQAWTEAYTAIVEVMLEGYPHRQVAQLADIAAPLNLNETYKTYARPLAEILDDLKQPFSRAALDNADGASSIFSAEQAIAQLFDRLAPGWEGKLINARAIGDCAIVTYCIVIHALEGTFSRESVGSAHLNKGQQGDPFAEAEARAFINAAAKWGLICEGIVFQN